MTFRRLMILGALASCSLLVAGANARADYTYSTSSPIPVPPAIPGLGEMFSTNSSTILDGATAVVPLVGITYTPTTFTGGTSQTLTWTETLATVGGGPSETFTITGTLGIAMVPGFGLLSQFNLGSITPTSGSGFTITYAGLVATSATTADLNFTLAPAVVPEPAGMALMGMGLVGVIGLGLRRSRARA